MSLLIPKDITPVISNLLKESCPPTDNIMTARFAMVGDFPTNIEVMEKEPFVGPHGNQLKRICSANQIPMYQTYLTLACKTMLPKNNKNKLYTAKGYRCPEWGKLQEKLIDELSHFKGNIIILLGDVAMTMLLDEPKFTSIDKYRGSVYKAEEFPHLKDKLAGKIIALTYHPSFTLARNKPVSFYTMIADLQKFKELDEDLTLLNALPIIKTRPLMNEVFQMFELIKQIKLMAFDIECTPKFITCFSIAVEWEHGIYMSMSIPLMSNTGNYWSASDEVKIWDMLAEVLRDKEIKIICQNGMFDLMFVLRTMGIISDNFFFDTMLAQHICWTDLPKGLDYLTSTYTYFPYYKDEGKQSHLGVIKDWDMYWNYNAKDSAYLLPIMKKLQEEIVAFNVEDAMKYIMKLHKPLMEMEFNGILTNRKTIKVAKESFERRINAMMHGLKKITGKELNINSPSQMIAYFYGTCMIKPYMNNKTKRPTCNAMALSRIARKKVKGSLEARMIIKMRTYGKLVSTYFTINVDADNRLRCSHKISGTVSGRIATEQTFFGTGANLQNQPYEYKKHLIPDPEYLLCEVDLAKAEAHVVAFLTQDLHMIESFLSGIDVHSFNASKIFNVPIEDVIKEAKEKKADQKKTMRYMGKKVVHASNYNMGPQTFSDQLAVEGIFKSQTECKRLLNAYQERFPGLKRWHGFIEQEIQQSRILYNLFGRPKRFLGLMNSALYRNAYSYKPQSTVAELLNRGSIKISNDPRLDRNHHDIDLLTTVHDSDLFQYKFKSQDLLKILLIISDHMNHTFTYKGKSFTIGLDAKIGFQWAGNKTAEISKFDKQSVEEALHKIGAN